MNAALFQLNKVRRLINTQGTSFTFLRQELDDFNEPTGRTISKSIKGVYHENTDYLVKQASTSATVRQKSFPMILCLWTDAVKLSHMDEVRYNGKLYTVGIIKNLSEANIVANISLEEVQTNV